jgi:hypothetical protein
MKYVMSWIDALTFHNDLPFIPLHYTYVPFTSSPQFTSPNLTSLHFTSLHCIFLISPTTSLRLIYHFHNPFSKITWFTGESPYITTYSPSRANQHLGGTWRLLPQCRRINKARTKVNASSTKSLTLPPKPSLNFNGLYWVTSQKIELFVRVNFFILEMLRYCS